MKPANVAMLVVGAWMGAGVVSPTGWGAGGWSWLAPAQAASSDVEGRKHARKANHLADVNKCKQAIPEFTKALRLLKDPTLLFNRAECYRRIGDSSKAVADYRRFLAELPGAPNRAQVEGQIAALDRSAAGRAGKTAAIPARPATATSLSGAIPPAPGPVAAPVPPSPPAPAAPPAPGVEEPVREAPAVADHEAPDLDEPRPLRRARPAAESAPPPSLIDSATKHEAAEPESSSSHWWAWALGAVVIGGGATATYFALKQGKTEIPSSTLGNFRF